MTIEIRQMVIKSSVGSGAEKAPPKAAGKAKAADDDCDCDDDCGGGGGGGGGQQERQKMRSAFATEWERMRER